MKDDLIYVRHIRDALDRIVAYTSTGRDAFFEQMMIQDAVLRNLEIVGEAAKRVSEATRTRSPDIPWRVLAGMRDKLIHDYPGTDLDVVWGTVDRDIPRLLGQIRQLLDDT